MRRNIIHKTEKRYGKRNRFFAAAAALVTATAMAVLTACGGGAASGTDPGTGETKKTAESDTDPGGQTAKGRYMEEEIELPEAVRENGLVDVIQQKDKSLLFCFPGEGQIAKLYTYDMAGSWTEEETVKTPEGLLPGRMTADENGKLYFGGFDREDYVFHLWTMDEDKTVRELLEDVFKIQEGKSYGIIPDLVGIAPGEKVLVSESSNATVYTADGRKTISMAQDFIGLDRRISACISDGEYLTLNNQKIVRYSLETGAQTGSFELPVIDTYAGQTPVFTDEEGNVYFANQTGLYCTGKNGTLWEQLIDGSLNSMSRQDIFLMAYFKGADDDYYGVFSTENSKMKLFHYYYDENVDTVPPETVTVYSMRDNATVRQAAAVLQKNNPQIKVEYRVAVEDEYEKVSEDVIRALNTELLNGQGADVLILDELPIETYRKKGILTDISNLFEKDDMLPNILNDFTKEDGKIYYMPARIDVPVVLGEKEAAAALQDIDKMAAYDKTPTLFAPDIYENVLNMTARLCYSQLFQKDGTIESDVLTRWLSAVKSAGEKGKLQVKFSQAEMEQFNVNNYVLPGGFGRHSDYSIITERCAAGTEVLNSIDSAMLTLSAAKMCGSSIESAGGLYMPTVVAGINASSANRENAEEFIRVLYGTEVQDESLRDGFAVRESSLDKWTKMEKHTSVALSSGEGITLSGSWPEQADRDNIIAIVRMADVPVIIDTQIMEMIVDGSRDYLDGKGTLEAAVSSIENKMKLYVSERE